MSATLPDVTEAGFRAALARDGFTEVLLREVPSLAHLPEHQHAWDARLLVLAGDMDLQMLGEARRHYGPGEWFEVPRERPHTEWHGPVGTTLLIGRRHAAG